MTEAAPPARSVRTLLAAGSRALAASESPRLDAELLLGAVLGLNRPGLVRERERTLDPAQATRFERLLAARAAGRPIAQILGRQEFWSFALEVDEHVLVPRPDTERLVEATIAVLPRAQASTIADLGTGSGAVAIAIAQERPPARVLAIERDPAALRVAARNVARHAPDRVRLVRGDWLGAVAPASLDAICANPPYLEDGDPALAQGPLAYEPRAALAGGADGLQALRVLCRAAPVCLRPGGWLLLEHGATQGAPVRRLLRAAGFVGITTLRDLAGHERVSQGRLG